MHRLIRFIRASGFACRGSVVSARDQRTCGLQRRAAHRSSSIPRCRIPFSDTARFQEETALRDRLCECGPRSDSWRVVMQHSLMEAASEHPDVIRQLIITNGNMDDAKQAADIQDLVSRGVDLLIVSANIAEGARSRRDPRDEAGHLRSSWSDGRISSDNLVSFVTSSDAMMGRVWAQWIVEKLHGKGNVIMLAGRGRFERERRP